MANGWEQCIGEENVERISLGEGFNDEENHV
jgi:hypothetical protein